MSPLRPVFSSSFNIAVQVNPPFIPADNQTWADPEDSFLGIGQAASIDLVIGHFLQGISIDSEPQALEHFVGNRKIGVERLPRLDAVGVKTFVGIVILRIPKVMHTGAEFQFTGGENREGFLSFSGSHSP